MAAVRKIIVASFSLIACLSLVVCDLSGENSNCELKCASNRSENVDEIGYCSRGCRLMRLADAIAYGPTSPSEILQMCMESCSNSYNPEQVVSVTACQKGCEFELPDVQMRQMELEMFYRDQIRLTQMYSLINKLLSCQTSMFNSPPDSIKGNGYVHTRVMYFSSEDGSFSGKMISQETQYEMSADDEELPDYGDTSVVERVVEGKSRLYTRVRHPDPAFVLLFVFGFVLLISFTILLCCPTQRKNTQLEVPAKPQKLSLYGDGEELSMLDDDSLIDIKPRAYMFFAAPHLPAEKRPL